MDSLFKLKIVSSFDLKIFFFIFIFMGRNLIVIYLIVMK